MAAVCGPCTLLDFARGLISSSIRSLEGVQAQWDNFTVVTSMVDKMLY